MRQPKTKNEFVLRVLAGAKAKETSSAAFFNSIVNGPREAQLKMEEAHLEIKCVLKGLPKPPREGDDDWDFLRRPLRRADKRLEAARYEVADAIEGLLFEVSSAVSPGLSYEFDQPTLAITRKAVRNAS